MRRLFRRGEPVPGIQYDADSIFQQPFMDLGESAEDRVQFILDKANGKRVLHFGFLDVPFMQERVQNGELLHSQLKEVSSFLHGVDIDHTALQEYRKFTKDQENSIMDVQDPEFDPKDYAKNFDLILFSETLEHVMNPGLALAGLRKIIEVNPDSQLCVTVPNALSHIHHKYAESGIELVHPDHYFYYSPHTLRKLLTDTGFRQVDIHLYVHPGQTIGPGITKSGVIGIASL